MPTCYMLIGIPTSGKSTWISNQSFDWSNTVVASTDNYVDKVAKERGKTYSEVFSEVMPDAVRHMVNTVIDAIKNNHDIIWDQTSTTIITRYKKFSMLPPNYKIIGVVFPHPEKNEIEKRNKSRNGKIVPEDVIQSMIDNYDPPSLDEGFDEIIYVR